MVFVGGLMFSGISGFAFGQAVSYVPINPVAAPGGAMPDPTTAIIPLGVNDSGVITGYDRYLENLNALSNGVPVAFSGTPSSLALITGIGGGGLVSELPTSTTNTGAGDSFGLAVNSAGVIAGSAYYPGNNQNQACLSGPGSVLMTMNGISNNVGTPGTTLGYSAGTTVNHAFAAAINDEGDVAGTANTASITQHAFVYTAATASNSNGGVVDISGGKFSSAYAIDPTGTIVAGFIDQTPGSGINTDKSHKTATVWNGSTGTWSATTLPALPGGVQSIAYGMSTKAGLIVGISELTGGRPDATAWVNNGGVYSAIDLNGPASGGTGSLNQSPLFTNWATATNYRNPLNYLNSGSNAAVGSLADAVNNEGQIVGYSYFYGGDATVSADQGLQSAFLCTLDASGNPTMIDLNQYAPAGIHFNEATAINNVGDVVGWGTVTSGPNIADVVGFELTGLTPASVPEPTASLLLIGASGAMLGRRPGRIRRV